MRNAAVRARRAALSETKFWTEGTAMKENRILTSLAAVCLAGTLAVAGCSKSNNNQQPTAQNPAATQPAPSTAAQPAPPPASGADTEAQNAPATPAPPPTLVIPAGTHLRVRLDEDLG